MAAYARDKGSFDVVFEASGAAAALATALACTRPGGTIVQLGLGAEIALPLSALVAREVRLVGSFRFHEEFDLALAMLAARRIDPAPMLTAVIPAWEAERAFDLASNRRAAMKVQIAFA
jgi:L-idonate 5-dehydrogenase